MSKGGLWHKFLDYLGFGPEEHWDEEEMEQDQDEAAAAEARGLAYEPVRKGFGQSHTPSKAPVVPITAAPTQRQQFKVLLVEPRSFEEVQTIADQLRARRPVILNLETIEKENKDVAQRILNFLSGATYALNGSSQRISNAIFFFAPQGVDVGTLGRGFTGTAIGGGSPDGSGAMADLLSQMQIERFQPERKGAGGDDFLASLRNENQGSRLR